MSAEVELNESKNTHPFLRRMNVGIRGFAVSDRTVVCLARLQRILHNKAANSVLDRFWDARGLEREVHTAYSIIIALRG